MSENSRRYRIFKPGSSNTGAFDSGNAHNAGKGTNDRLNIRHRSPLPKELVRRGGRVGRPSKIRKPNFTPEQIEAAVQVMMYSKTIYNWVISEAEFVGTDLNTPAGHEFFRQKAREAAEKIIR